MKNFITIFKFELMQTIRSKTFIGVTVAFVLLVGVGMYMPNIIGAFQDGKSKSDNTSIDNLETIYIVNNTDVEFDYNSLEMYFPDKNIEVVDNKEKIESAIKSKEINTGIVITDELSFEYHVNNAELYNSFTSVFEGYMQDNHKIKVLEGLELNSIEVLDELDKEVTYEKVVHGTDGTNQVVTAMALMFMIFFMIITYGSVIATNVASEKGNRTMELLVTSTKTTSLIYGKVLAGCSSIFLQGLILLSAVKGFYNLNRDSWNGMLDSILDISMEVIVAFILFGILGYICYAFIFATCGAMVSKVEDVNSTLQPVTLISVVVFYSVFFGMNNPDGILMKCISFIPLSSPLAMFMRMTLVEVPIIEVAISFAILLITTILTAWGCSKMYRRATLMYGNEVGIMKFFKKK